ncbi:RNA polymerase sigma factor [Fibrella aquatilis]|uniref:Sigma-70 family RNA polymerase sigma factor n=1 Tax=Fibrella aquatilis TaxID=2817059 RepID=A0A939G6V6_9BACT|nr:sigma-70 family RNA polymerase sigma factor [Fibrella aquatilis]MBO0931131.1 sigma-70 family RNA polymerase sigma factor [Fibrella aquatilis]
MNTPRPFSETVALIGQRDPKTWNELLRRSKHRMVGYARRFGAFSDEDIADLISETFVVLLRRIDAGELVFNDEMKLDAYLLRIFINLVHNALRKKSQSIKLHVPLEQLESVDDDDEPLLKQRDTLDTWFDGTDPTDEQERIGQMKRALTTLPDRDRELLLLWAQGYTYDALGELFGFTNDYLKVKLYRIRQHVARWFAQHTPKIAML